MMDDRMLQRGLLLAEIEEAESELNRVWGKAAKQAAAIHAVLDVLKDAGSVNGNYDHEQAQMRRQSRIAVTTESKYRDAMDFNAVLERLREIDKAKETLTELRARKADHEFRSSLRYNSSPLP